MCTLVVMKWRWSTPSCPSIPDSLSSTHASVYTGISLLCRCHVKYRAQYTSAWFLRVMFLFLKLWLKAKACVIFQACENTSCAGNESASRRRLLKVAFNLSDVAGHWSKASESCVPGGLSLSGSRGLIGEKDSHYMREKKSDLLWRQVCVFQLSEGFQLFFKCKIIALVLRTHCSCRCFPCRYKNAFFSSRSADYHHFKSSQ